MAGTPIPEDENRLISFAVTTETPTTSLQGLHQAHENISSVCQSMIPDHGGAQAQDSAAPYSVTVSSRTVAPDGVVSGNRCGPQNTHVSRYVCRDAIPPPMALCPMSELYVVSQLMLTPYIPVRFSGLSDQQYRGLYVQARNEQNEPVGRFQPSDDEHVRLSSCGNGRDVSDPLPCNCLKHSGNYIYHPLQHARALRPAHSTFLCFLWLSHCSAFFNRTNRSVLLIET